MRVGIVGAGGHGSVVYDCLLLLHGQALDPALYDDAPDGDTAFGLRVLGPLDALIASAEVERVFVAVGDNESRRRITRRLAKAGKAFLTIVHPFTAISPRAHIGIGSIAVAGTVVNAGARVGDGVILNTHCSVGHDCLVEDFAQIAPGVNLGGGAVIGERAFLGIGAKVAPLVRVGAGAVVGAGSVVLEDLPAGCFAYGTPARVVRSAHGSP